MAVAEHPEKSNRAIAAETGISEKSIRLARHSTAAKDAVGKRIGLDGKTRRLPRHDNPMQSELKHVPAAAELAERIAAYLKEFKQEAGYHGVDTSPRRVTRLVHELLNDIFAHIPSPIAKAKVCENCASEWKIDETNLNDDVVGAVRKAAQAWGDLLEKVEAAADCCGDTDRCEGSRGNSSADLIIPISEIAP
jgi:hypothetical protein